MMSRTWFPQKSWLKMKISKKWDTVLCPWKTRKFLRAKQKTSRRIFKTNYRKIIQKQFMPSTTKVNIYIYIYMYNNILCINMYNNMYNILCINNIYIYIYIYIYILFSHWLFWLKNWRCFWGSVWKGI